MGKKQKRSDQAYTYLRHTMTVCTLITGNSAPELAGVGIDLLYKNLEWADIWTDSVSAKQVAKLKAVVQEAYKKACADLPTDKRGLLKRGLPGILQGLDEALENGNLTSETMEAYIVKMLHSPSVREGEWLTPRDLDALCAHFLQHLWLEIRQSPELDGVASLDSIRALADEVRAIVKRVDGLEDDMDSVKADISQMKQRVQSNVVVQAVQIMETVIFGPTRNVQVVTHGMEAPSAFYDGRRAVENDLRGLIREGKQILLHGMGGLGKTQVLRSLFRQYAGKDGWSGEDGIDSIGCLAYTGDADDMVYNGIRYERTGDREVDGRTAWAVLENAAYHRKLLLLIDDIRPECEGVAASIDLGKLAILPCAVILASRVAVLQGFHPVYLDYLSNEQCPAFFQAVYGKPVAEEAEQAAMRSIVFDRAGRHTLAIELLARSATKCFGSLAEMEAALRKEAFHIEQGDRDESIQAEFQKLYRMAQLCGEESSILEAFSIFPYIPLAMDTCIQWLYEDAGVPELRCRKLLVGLAEKGWLQRSVSGDGREEQMAMHAVVAAAVAGQVDLQFEDHTNLVRQCCESIMFTLEQTFHKAAPYVPFAEAMNRAFKMENSQLARICVWIGNYYDHLGEYAKALIWDEKALKIRKKVLGSKHRDTATSYNNVARHYEIHKDYAKALAYYRKALRIRKRVYGSRGPDTATIYNNIAGLYHRLVHYQKALRWYNKTLKIWEREFGPDHINTAAIYNNLAAVYRDQGYHLKALEWYDKALRFSEKVLVSEHPLTAITYNGIAEVYHNQGEFTKAINMYKKALRIRETVLGLEHPETAITYNNIAGVYDSKGDYTEALSWLEKALTLLQYKLGTDHPYTLSVKNNIESIKDSLSGV